MATIQRNDPERLSTTAVLEPFAPAEFVKDPNAYLSRVEPARCFQTAEPGQHTPRLEAVSAARTEVPSGGAVRLEVKGVPLAPVTFTTFDGGHFKENGLPSITVRAESSGKASVHYVASPGVSGDVAVVVGSPLTSGNQDFLLSVAGELL
jgi:hypothetical protein